MVADSDGHGVGGHLVADLSRGFDNSLDHGVVGNSANRGEGVGEGSMGKGEGGMGVGKTTEQDLGISLSLPLAVAVGVAVAEAVGSVGKRSNGGNSGQGVGSNGQHRGVVDQGGGGGEDLGVAVKDGSISLPLAVGKTMAVADSMSKGQTGVAVAKAVGSVGKRSNGGDGQHRGVVDQGGGGSEDLGVAVKDGSISLPLAVGKPMAIAVSVVANSDRQGVGGHLMVDFSRGHDDTLDHGVVGNSANRGEGVGKGGDDRAGVGQSVQSMAAQQELSVGLRGGGGHGGEGGLGGEVWRKVFVG